MARLNNNQGMAGRVAPAPPCTFPPNPCVLRDGRERLCGLAVLGISQDSRLAPPSQPLCLSWVSTESGVAQGGHKSDDASFEAN